MEPPVPLREVCAPKKKLRRKERVKTAVMERLARWEEGQVEALWSEARKAYPTAPTAADSAGSREANIRRATECAQDGRLGKAVAALLSLGLIAPTEQAVRKCGPNTRGTSPQAASADCGAGVDKV